MRREIDEALIFSGAVFFRREFGRRYFSAGLVANAIVVIAVSALVLTQLARYFAGIVAAIWTASAFVCFGASFVYLVVKHRREMAIRDMRTDLIHSHDSGVPHEFWDMGVLEVLAKRERGVERFIEPGVAAALGWLMLVLNNYIGVYLIWMSLRMGYSAYYDYIHHRHRLIDLADAAVEGELVRRLLPPQLRHDGETAPSVVRHAAPSDLDSPAKDEIIRSLDPRLREMMESPASPHHSSADAATTSGAAHEMSVEDEASREEPEGDVMPRDQINSVNQ